MPLLQGIFLTQESNQCLLRLLRLQLDSLPPAPPGKPHWTFSFCPIFGCNNAAMSSLVNVSFFTKLHWSSSTSFLKIFKTLLHCWWECSLVQPLWKIVWRFLKKLEIELPYDPAVLLLGIYLEKNRIRKDTCTPVFLVALFTIAKTWKQPKCSLTGKRIKKMWYVMEYFQPIKRMK